MDKANGGLISREATLKLWCANCIITKFGKVCNRPCRDIERIKAVPAVDAVPVVHARWVYYNGYVIPNCSACGFSISDIEWRFCPRCGAVLDEGEVVND